jgi:hypothetical protein
MDKCGAAPSGTALYRMGYRSRMTGHGFRGVASTILHEQGFAHEHIELQLAHEERDDTSAAYNYALYIEAARRDDAGMGGSSGRAGLAEAEPAS